VSWFEIGQGFAMDLRVECNVGSSAEPEPSVIWFGSRRVAVRSVLDRWYGPGQRWWKVATDEGPYVLREDGGNSWVLAAVVRE
jgi:hypothetical protein